MLGKHCIKACAKSQAIIAESSAGSEHYGVITGSFESLGLQTDLGMEIGIRLNLDASAAKGILKRLGVSKIRHMDVNNLWLQEQCARNIIPAIKVDGTSNSLDLLTKHLTYGVIERHVKALQLEFRAGRSEAATQLRNIRRKQRQE